MAGFSGAVCCRSGRCQGCFGVFGIFIRFLCAFSRVFAVVGSFMAYYFCSNEFLESFWGALCTMGLWRSFMFFSGCLERILGFAKASRRFSRCLERIIGVLRYFFRECLFGFATCVWGYQRFLGFVHKKIYVLISNRPVKAIFQNLPTR